MKATPAIKLYAAILLVIFAGIVIHAPLSVGLGVLFPQFDLAIKTWKEILMLAALAVAIVIVTRRGMWKELFNDWIMRLIAAFAALHVLLIPVFYSGPLPTVAGLVIDLRYLLFFALVYVLLKLAPGYRRLMLQVGLAGAFVVVGFATMQFFLPPDILTHIGYGRDTIMPYLTIDKNTDYIRVNSTLRGPNPLGAYAVIVLSVLAAAITRQWLNLRDSRVRLWSFVLFVCSATALWISYSRSALVAAAIGIGIVLFLTVFRKFSPRMWITTIVIVGAIAGSLIAGLGGSFVSNVLLHENPEGGSSVSSNEEHFSSLGVGFERLISQPLGAGVGSTGSASLFGDESIVIENQYLFIAHESGWLGLGLFIAIFAAVLFGLWKKRADWLALGVFASGVALGAIGLLQPVWVDDTVSIVWWGLAAVALTTGGKNAGRAKSKQKTARAV
ncbi:MAG TPA: hypothetical protein VFZ62_04115 [Candidatus Saccharimonadales bacterium]